MKNKNLFLYFIWFIGISVCLYMIYQHKMNLHYKNNAIIAKIINLKEPIEISKIDVIKGHEFDLLLKDGRRIHAFLSVESVKDSDKKVIQILSECKDPKVILIKKQEFSWQVEIYFTIKDLNNKDIEVSLDEWLKQKGLIYN